MRCLPPFAQCCRKICRVTLLLRSRRCRVMMPDGAATHPSGWMPFLSEPPPTLPAPFSDDAIADAAVLHATPLFFIACCLLMSLMPADALMPRCRRFRHAMRAMPRRLRCSTSPPPSPADVRSLIFTGWLDFSSMPMPFSAGFCRRAAAVARAI